MICLVRILFFVYVFCFFLFTLVLFLYLGTSCALSCNTLLVFFPHIQTFSMILLNLLDVLNGVSCVFSFQFNLIFSPLANLIRILFFFYVRISNFHISYIPCISLNMYVFLFNGPISCAVAH